MLPIIMIQHHEFIPLAAMTELMRWWLQEQQFDSTRLNNSYAIPSIGRGTLIAPLFMPHKLVLSFGKFIRIITAIITLLISPLFTPQPPPPFGRYHWQHLFKWCRIWKSIILLKIYKIRLVPIKHVQIIIVHCMWKLHLHVTYSHKSYNTYVDIHSK